MKTKLIIPALLILSLRAQSQGIHSPNPSPVGFNTASPANRVEITSDPADPYGNNISTNGSSGLRLKYLTSQITGAAAGTGKVLSVDANGDVILVNDQVGGPTSGIQTVQNGLTLTSPGGIMELGGPLSFASAANLLSHREIPMNGYNLLFSGNNNPGTDQITLGLNPGVLGKLNVTTFELTNASPGLSFAGIFDNTYSGLKSVAGYFDCTKPSPFTNTAVKGIVSNAPANLGVEFYAGPCSNSGTATAGFFKATDNNSGTTTGLQCMAQGGTLDSYALSAKGRGTFGDNYGGQFEADGALSSQTIIGVQATSDANGLHSFGGYFQSPNSNNIPASLPSTNYGVRAFAPTKINYPGWNNSFAILCDGRLNVAGTAFATSGLPNPSDRRYKENIKPLENVIAKIKRLSGYSYNFKTDEFKERGFDNYEHIGFMAQELKEVFPNLVETGADGYLGVKYQEMIPVLLEVRKETQSQINEQQADINELKSKVNELLVKQASGR